MYRPILIDTITINKSSILTTSVTCIDTVSIIAPAMIFPMNIPNKAYFILILNINAKTASGHNPVVGSGTPTNIIKPIILAAFSLFTLPSIFLSHHLLTCLKYFLYLK